MFRLKRSNEERCSVSPDMEKKSIGQGGNNSILSKHNMDISLISQNMSEEKENMPNYSNSTMKTSRRKRILMNAANKMKNTGTLSDAQREKSTTYQGEGADTKESISHNNKRGMNIQEHQYTDLKMVKAEKIVYASELLSIPSPQSIQRAREAKDLQMRMLGCTDIKPTTKFEMNKVRSRKKLKAAIRQNDTSWEVESPFNEHTHTDYGFCISRRDINDAMNDYRKAARSLIMSEISSPTTYGSNIRNEDSKVQDSSIASNKFTQARIDAPHNCGRTESLGIPSNSLSTYSSFISSPQSSIYSRSYNHFDDDLIFSGSRSKTAFPRRFTSRSRNIVEVAAARTMQLLDIVVDRACDCIAPTNNGSPIQRLTSKRGNENVRLNGNEWNDAFYRKHRFENEYHRK